MHSKITGIVVALETGKEINERLAMSTFILNQKYKIQTLQIL